MNKTLMLLVALTAVGCASTPPPSEQNAASQSAIRGAKEVGAQGVPEASLFLRLSEEEVARSKVLLANGDKSESDLALKRADADAELAIALTRQKTAEDEAKAQTAKLQAAKAGK